MDMDLLKSAPEDQMEMMLMMQMDKLHDFSSAAYSELPIMDFTTTAAAAHQGQGSSSSTTNNNNIALSQVLDNSHVSSSSTFMNLPSTISFTTSSPPIHQEQSTLPFMPNSTSGKWRNVNGQLPTFPSQSQKRNSMAAMREMIFRIAAMQPIHIDPESVKPPKRRNVKISKDPQSVAARHRRERISERIRILQRLVPGGTKMDTASMLDEAIHYVKFLKNQVQSLERAGANRPSTGSIGFPVPMSSGSYLPMAAKAYHPSAPHQNVQHYTDAN